MTRRFTRGEQPAAPTMATQGRSYLNLNSAPIRTRSSSLQVVVGSDRDHEEETDPGFRSLPIVQVQEPMAFLITWSGKSVGSDSDRSATRSRW